MTGESSESKDDTIPVEEVVASAATPAGPVEEVVGKAPSEPTPTTEPGFMPDAQVIDDLLLIEDPEFAEAMRELKKDESESAGSESHVEIDSLDIHTIVNDGNPGEDGPLHKRLIWRYFIGPNSWGRYLKHLIIDLGPALLVQARRFFETVKSSVKRTFGAVQSWMASYRSLPRKSKFLLWAAMALGVLSLLTLKVSLSGQVNLDIGPGFLNSFADVADAKFVYSKDDPREDFTDPLLHPEYIVAMDRFVINLKSPYAESGANPMGLFAFYFEASNQDCAVELKDREGEARDIVSRTLEQMTYDELISVAGKEKLKLSLRKALNTILTQGQIRRVYLKNIVLKE